MLSIDQIFNFIDQDTAEATLQGNRNELRQIHKVATFLSQTAEETGDRATAGRSQRIAAIVADALKRIEH